MAQYRVDFEAIPWETPIDGLRFKALRQSGRQLRLVEYTREMKPHWCEKGHIGYVLEGRFEIRYAQEIQVYRPGDGVFIPPGPAHKHMGQVVTDLVRVIFVEEV